jgi:hypothetical protein
MSPFPPQLDYSVGTDFAAQTFKGVTVYGGVEWYHQYQVNPDQSYAETRAITNYLKEPSANFEKALHEYFDIYVT